MGVSPPEAVAYQVLVKEFRDGEWRFELPFGELFIRKPGEILSINLIDTIPDILTVKSSSKCLILQDF